MLGKHKFKVGQRVKPSETGRAAHLFDRWPALRGIVTKVDRFNSPTVLWDGRKTPKGYHPDFIAPARGSKT